MTTATMQEVMDSEELYAFADLDWIVVKTNDTDAVIEALGLEELQEGSFEDFGEDTNTFVIPAWGEWTLVIHAWEPRGSSPEYLDAIEKCVTDLSQQFGEAQAFASYEENISYVHWVLAKKGELLRSFASASETELFRNFGEATEAEGLIDWVSEEVVVSSSEVIQVARSWSIEPFYSDHPEFESLVFDGVPGMLGNKQLDTFE
jgi:hypothetical protein